MTKGWYGNKHKHALASRGIKSTDVVRIKNELNSLPQPTRKIAMDFLNNNVAHGKRIEVDWSKGYLTEREILLLKARLNRGEDVDLSAIYSSDGFAITEEQTKKGYDWLMNQWKTPRGVERKNNPFGFREEDILDNFIPAKQIVELVLLEPLMMVFAESVEPADEKEVARAGKPKVIQKRNTKN